MWERCILHEDSHGKKIAATENAEKKQLRKDK